MQVKRDDSDASAGDEEGASPLVDAPANPDRTIGSARLHIIPVDAQRIFAHWYVPPELLKQSAEHAKTSHLTLRVLDVDDSKTGAFRTTTREEFSVSSGWHDGFMSLSSPGGSIAATLGVQNDDGGFFPLLTSMKVSMPQSPAAPAFKPRPGIAKTPAVSAPVIAEPPQPTQSKSPPPPGVLPKAPVAKPPVLDETSIVKRALGPDDLLPELRALPGTPRNGEAFDTIRAETIDLIARHPLPKTPALDEHQTVTTALKSAVDRTPIPQDEGIAAGPPPPAFQAAAAPNASQAASETTATPETVGSESSDSSARYASFFDENEGAAPLQLRANLILKGTLLPGHRLRLGSQEIEAKPGGSFSHQQPLNSFPLAWSFLQQVAAAEAANDLPSIELLTKMPENRSPLTLEASVEIEGQICDPDYRKFLPRGVNTDTAGRFHIVRRLAAGAWFLPQLALFAKTETAG